jgi:acyl-CoA-binding protein
MSISPSGSRMLRPDQADHRARQRHDARVVPLFKQAPQGDATGSRPGMLDVRGRAKFDAWAKHKGKTKDAAMEAYIALVAKHAK